MCDEVDAQPWLPSDVSLPFFAYGLFKPGELAYFQIRDLAIAEPATVKGRLLIRDGVPFLDKSVPDGHVHGALLRFAEADRQLAYGRIAAMESKYLYAWDTVTAENGVTANALIGRSPQQGHPIDWPDWDGWRDPLFVDALELVERRAAATRDSGRPNDYKRLFERQMTYMLLWVAIERYLSLRYSLGSDVTKKLVKLAEEPAFKAGLLRYVHRPAEVRRADKPGYKERLDQTDPKSSLDYYYQVRSNVTHRGKTAPETDCEILQTSLDELAPIFRHVLDEAKKEAGRDRVS